VSKTAKVDQPMIHRIKELRNQQKTQAEIAAEVGVAQGTVSLVLRTLDLGGPLVTQRKRA
jgi:transcriptional regulator with XRE-family HTH domain